MNKTHRIIYFVATALISIMMVASATFYFVGHSQVSAEFIKIGYPTYIIYPLAIIKILGVIAIWVKKSKTLTEWAYAGFFFDFVIAFFAHIMISDGEHWGAVIALTLLLISYIFGKKTEAL